MPPEGRLVQRRTPRALLHRVDVGLDGVALHRFQRAVHCRLSELRPRLLLGRRGSFLWHRVRAERQQLAKRLGKVAEEELLILGILLRVGAEGGVGLDRHVRRQHHELARHDVLELERAVPLAGSPLHMQEGLKVLVVKLKRVTGPGTVEATPLEMASSECVGPREGDDFLVVESHAAKHITKVGGALGRIGKTTGDGAEGAVGRVPAAETHLDLGSSQEFHRHRPGVRPQVRVRDLGVLGLHLQQHVARDRQSCVRGVLRLRCKSHRRPI
mmetsp:Transcript_7/g.31  ORF Transcript_7/g.31 Transcript_7/m.31 type:complete len:271 (-) Transcript_7:375-1187(-)